MKTDWYDVLQVAPDADMAVIHSAYRALVKQSHPDAFHGDKTLATERMKLLNEAYNTLGDENKRRQYDRKRARANSPSGKRIWERIPLWMWIGLWLLVMPKILGWMMVSPLGKGLLITLTTAVFWRLMPPRGEKKQCPLTPDNSVMDKPNQ